MGRTKKEKALDDILELKMSWCLNKTVNGGCTGCPMSDDLHGNYCSLQTLKGYIDTFYDDRLERRIDIYGN